MDHMTHKEKGHTSDPRSDHKMSDLQGSHGSLHLRVSAVGDQTALSGIMRLVAAARASASRAQALADCAAALFFTLSSYPVGLLSPTGSLDVALTEAVTRITEGHVPDAVFERARAHFNEQELIALVFTLTTINAWNRLAITMRTEVGNYQPKARPVSQTA
jgi:hypothetical protein